MKAKDIREREKIKKIEEDLKLKILKPGDAGDILPDQSPCVPLKTFTFYDCFILVNYPKYGDSVSV